MQFYNSNNRSEKRSFREAVLKGLADDGGLFIPEIIPQLPPEFIESIESYTDLEIAFTVLKPYVEDDVTDTELRDIVSSALTFQFPTVEVEPNIFSLELYHGPTLSFKDVGARFLSRFMSLFNSGSEKSTVLTATSGDTGSAVASGFYNVENVDVKVLFPKGRVSPFQEYQMSSLGKNITAIEVDGTFDDCQALVKEAFRDKELNQKMNLSSANSINIARLLPQMIYYFIAYKQLKISGNLSNKSLVVSVPSGNFGNITAGIIGRKMGLPIKRFIAAVNDNDTFYNYINSGVYTPKPSVDTYSNAMDVGAPSNFDRVLNIVGGHAEISALITSYTISNSETIQEIDDTYKASKYILDPHGAVGKLSLQREIKEGEVGMFLETASPKKFEEVVSLKVKDITRRVVDLKECSKESCNGSYSNFIEFLK